LPIRIGLSADWHPKDTGTWWLQLQREDHGFLQVLEEQTVTYIKATTTQSKHTRKS